LTKQTRIISIAFDCEFHIGLYAVVLVRSC